ncbi:transporter [Sphingobacterium thermophilum]|uniref:Transporter n=1 Tax=Sphingobacterium thermophilum TaxID=768534 RepID=A0ABP8QYC4_9SPHI
MKKLTALIIAYFAATGAYACDICGGGLGNSYNGLLTNFNKRFVGVRYHFNQLYTQLDIHGNITALSNKEKYHTAEIWSAWNIHPKWRVMAIIPYSKIFKYNYGTTSEINKSGLGDINVSTYYNLLNTSNNSNHNVWLGIGVKLPTGEYRKEDLDTNSPNIYQLGTGSLDLIASASYDIRLDNMGLNTNLSYKWNTENSEKYRYGNKTTLNASLYYLHAFSEKSNIRPHAGIQYEYQTKDRTLGYILDQTGGYNLNLNVGAEATIHKLAVGVFYQSPLQQNISNHRTELIQKVGMHVTFTF